MNRVIGLAIGAVCLAGCGGFGLIDTSDSRIVGDWVSVTVAGTERVYIGEFGSYTFVPVDTSQGYSDTYQWTPPTLALHRPDGSTGSYIVTFRTDGGMQWRRPGEAGDGILWYRAPQF
jgi:hypothetical protein